MQTDKITIGDPPHTAFAPAHKQTRVVLFTNSVAVGGMEEHVLLLARHLNRTRFEVFAVSPDWQATEEFSQELAKVADYSVQTTPDHRYGLLRLVHEFVRLFVQLRAWQADVMHMHSTTYRGQYYALLAAKLAGVKRVYVTEHLAPECQLSRLERTKRYLFSWAVDGIVCVSQKNFLARASHLYTPKRKTLVVNNGVDLDDFEPRPAAELKHLREQLAIPADAQIIGSAVRFEPEKGLNYLLDAMPAILAACPNTYLLLVGDGSLRGQLQAQAEQLGIASHIRFTGFQSDPRPYVSLMDTFVLPVPVGSMSIGLLEAMALRRAVVMSFGGEGEAVVHGTSGFCAEPHSADSIAEYTIRILRDPALKRQLGEAARHRIEDAFSAQQVARKLSQLYEFGFTQGKPL